MPTEPHIIRDLGNKLSDDIEGAIARTISLAPESEDRLLIALRGSEATIGWLGACLASNGLRAASISSGANPSDAMWSSTPTRWRRPAPI